MIGDGFEYGKFLKSRMRYWLLCLFTWELTLGYQSTQMQEVLFASFKLLTGRKRVLLHQIIDIFRKVMKSRVLNYKEKTKKYLETEPSLVKSFKEEGFEKLIDLSLVELTPVGRKMLFQQLTYQKNYSVLEISNEDATVQCDQLLNFRGGCALRLKNLITDTISSSDTSSTLQCYKVFILLYSTSYFHTFIQ